MTTQPLISLTLQELVAEFVEVSLQQERAERLLEQSKINRAVRRRFEIRDELKCRDGDQRRMLRDLYDHPSSQVQLNAASSTLFHFPEEARQKIEYLSRWEVGLVALEARTLLSALDKRGWVPT
ncbi:DUF2019 domain-containing protein [Mangrovibrevibacter kandeliae]|uniref:DUF2019 domain-containing protein n=1 Tax=Mangrovibrevibacter kandeliae TaxID=2968473 RepID=UPI00211769A9|nr:DUF2019 domain-containing protein [Aurantimonas sp. CSK15Z-1]MCQ8783342.1 DUF2019 domain-containing protein [Aurantimonas sp. CSK15Z-1]